MYRVFLFAVILTPLAAQQYDPYTGFTVEETALDAPKDVKTPPLRFKTFDDGKSAKLRKAGFWGIAFEFLLFRSLSTAANSFGLPEPSAATTPASVTSLSRSSGVGQYLPKSFGPPYYGSAPYESTGVPNFSLGVRNPYNPFIHTSPPLIPPALPRFPAIPQP